MPPGSTGNDLWRRAKGRGRTASIRPTACRKLTCSKHRTQRRRTLAERQRTCREWQCRSLPRWLKEGRAQPKRWHAGRLDRVDHLFSFVCVTPAPQSSGVPPRPPSRPACPAHRTASRSAPAGLSAPHLHAARRTSSRHQCGLLHKHHSPATTTATTAINKTKPVFAPMSLLAFAADVVTCTHVSIRKSAGARAR